MANAYEDIAKAALIQYPVAQGKLNFLGHSGNVTFCVEASESKFLLRIHQSVSGIEDDIWQKPNVIESELMWLTALSRESNITVQKPLQNQEGKWVTQIPRDNTQDVFYCSLLGWIDGVVSNAERTPQQAYQLGLLIGKLHQHSRKWKLPQNLERPIYDENHFLIALSKLAPAVTSSLISAEHQKLLTAAVQKSESIMKTLDRSPDIWGLIHADLHDGNYLFYNEQIRPIDFARCGFGYYLYDIAESLQYLSRQVRPSFFEGYQTICKLPENYLEIVEAFFIMALIDVFSFHVNNPKEHEWLSQEVQYVAEQVIPKYLESESFLFNSY